MNILISIAISLLISAVPLITIIKEKKKGKDNLLDIVKKKKFYIIASLILLIGCLIRLVLIDKVPAGLNQDEASIGYDAYSILNYGIDRNGIKLPLHLIAWGSGQNALYAYMIMPFIKIFGLTTFAVRLPMAILGCITLLATYYFSKEYFNKKNALIFLFIFMIIPWHIMKSRWGLESNVFPDLIYLSTILIYFYLKKDKKIYLYISSILLGISTYAYGTSYFFVPIYFLLVYTGLFMYKKIKIKEIIKQLVVVGLISLPMIAFVIINYFDLPEINLGIITIPRLDYNRFVELTNIGGNFFSNSITNIKTTISLLITQNDGLLLNSIPRFGVFYLFSLPIIIIGLVKSLSKIKKDPFHWLMFAFFITSILLSTMLEPNINRINTLWFPLIFYLAYGLLKIKVYGNIVKKILILLYSVSFIYFVVFYFKDYNETLGTYTRTSFEDTSKFASKLEYRNIYIDEYYIYWPYYTKMNPNDYLKQRVIPVKNVMFQKVLSIGNANFVLPKDMVLNKKDVYILSNYRLQNNNYNLNGFSTKKFKNYTVIYYKGN